MNFIRNIIVFFSFAIIALGSLMLVIWFENSIILPSLGEQFSEYGIWVILTTIIIWIWKVLPFLGDIFAPLYSFKRNKTDVQTGTTNKNNKAISQTNNSNNPPTIIPKPLGGYGREQLKHIYLLGILVHQIYYSAIGNSLSEKQQRKALSIQMRFFITVFPQRNVKEYFDFTESFMDKNEGLSNYSVLEVLERSTLIFSSCGSKQIRKLQTLYNTLYTLYIEIGGGNKAALNSYLKLLDTELSNLTVEDDWRNHYAKKKTH